MYKDHMVTRCPRRESKSSLATDQLAMLFVAGLTVEPEELIR